MFITDSFSVFVNLYNTGYLWFYMLQKCKLHYMHIKTVKLVLYYTHAAAKIAPTIMVLKCM